MFKKRIHVCSYMDTLGYIFEIFPPDKRYRISDLDVIFLQFIREGTTSAYQIFSRLKKEQFPVSYKNVHRRIQKLFDSNMIEEIKTQYGFKHGARNFRLTTRGLVYVFSEVVHPTKLKILLSYYYDNTLFRTFLYPILEANTIKSATYSLSRLIENYLEECCSITRYALDRMTKYVKDVYPGDPYRTQVEIRAMPPIRVLEYQLNWHVQSFILKLAFMTNDVIDWWWIPSQHVNAESRRRFSSMEKIRCMANDKMETYALLANDKKFMKALGIVEKRFSAGYNTIIDLKNKTRK
jgi:hypothetical protein